MYGLPIDRTTDTDTVKRQCVRMYEMHDERLQHLLRVLSEVSDEKWAQIKEHHAQFHDGFRQRLTDRICVFSLRRNLVRRLKVCRRRTKCHIHEVMCAGNGCSFLLDQGSCH
jgi:hypothetical protein